MLREISTIFFVWYDIPLSSLTYSQRFVKINSSLEEFYCKKNPSMASKSDCNILSAYENKHYIYNTCCYNIGFEWTGTLRTIVWSLTYEINADIAA